MVAPKDAPPLRPAQQKVRFVPIWGMTPLRAAFQACASEWDRSVRSAFPFEEDTMRRSPLGVMTRLTAFALMACALAVIGCDNAPVTTKTPEEPPPTGPDPNAGIAWREIRTGYLHT